MSKAPSMKTEQLTAAEEIELIRRINADYRMDRKALDKLVLCNLGLIHKIVHRFPLKNAACTYDDLFQEGVAGLIHGINKFDETRGYRLSTYCYRWIQAYVSRYYQNHGKTIRIPVHLSDTAQRMRKQEEMLTKELEHMPTSSECEQHIEGYNDMKVATREIFSLNAMMSEDSELEALAGEDNTDMIDESMDCDLLLDKLKAQVSERDFDILCMRFGLLGHPEHTLSEISDAFGVTRARCHQVQKQCIQQLRQIQAS